MNEFRPWGMTHSAMSFAPGARLIRRLDSRPAAVSFAPAMSHAPGARLIRR